MLAHMHLSREGNNLQVSLPNMAAGSSNPTDANAHLMHKDWNAQRLQVVQGA